MADLVIVESPTKAKIIGGYLGAEYDVQASIGHIRDLPAARMAVDVKNDFKPDYTIVRGKNELVKELKKKAEGSKNVYLATDPDREGEAISWHLANVLGIDLKNAKRVKFNEINKNSVIKGMKTPEPIDLGLVDAQQARRVLDRLVGYNLSPFVSKKIRPRLSAGRVQSVALRMICDREDEIKAFVPVEYWSVDAMFKVDSCDKTFSAALAKYINKKITISNKENADEIIQKIKNSTYKAATVKKGKRKQSPVPPFTTSTLQQTASSKLSYAAGRTMKIAQQLYEGINVKGFGATGLITYMRTDSLRISEEARAQANEFIAENYGKEYIPEKQRYFKNKGNAQDGHEAIRPTNVNITPELAKSSLTTEQLKLYTLIWNRFIACLMAESIQNTVKVEIEATEKNTGNIFTFNANGHSIYFDGFLRVYNYEDDEDKILPEIKQGDKLTLENIKGNQHFTEGPSRFSEGSLIKKLEEDGVGRPSTYATIVSTIIAREYVRREAKQLAPTELGYAVCGLLKDYFPEIVDIKFTAEMETKLDKIESHETDYVTVLKSFWGNFDSALKQANENTKGIKIKLSEDMTDLVCEKCGSPMEIKRGRYGKFLACTGYPECKSTKPYFKPTGVSCPKCGKEIYLRESHKGYVFYGCSGYPECDFITWDIPTEKKCPQCNKPLFKKNRGKGFVCLMEGCGYTEGVVVKKKSTAKKEQSEEKVD